MKTSRQIYANQKVINYTQSRKTYLNGHRIKYILGKIGSCGPINKVCFQHLLVPWDLLASASFLSQPAICHDVLPSRFSIRCSFNILSHHFWLELCFGFFLGTFYFFVGIYLVYYKRVWWICFCCFMRFFCASSMYFSSLSWYLSLHSTKKNFGVFRFMLCIILAFSYNFE